MQIKKDYILRVIGGENVVVSIGSNIANFNGVITLNDTAAFLWRSLNTAVSKEKLVEELCREYDVSEEKAEKDIEQFLQVLKEHDILEEE